MDLKIKDVAELLSVSETTIRRWLMDGKIPAYRINGQYRFSRTEIEDWVLSQKLDNQPKMMATSPRDEKFVPLDSETFPGSNQFSLFRALNKGGVYHDVPGKTKQEVIHEAMRLIAQPLELDAEVLTDLLMDREKLMSTALGQGIAVPHTRDFLLHAHYDVVAVVFTKEPIDYGALDGQPVSTLFFLLACQDKRHLHLLAKIAHLCAQPGAIDLLRQRPEKQDFLNYVKQSESQLVPLATT